MARRRRPRRAPPSLRSSSSPRPRGARPSTRPSPASTPQRSRLRVLPRRRVLSRAPPRPLQTPLPLRDDCLLVNLRPSRTCVGREQTQTHSVIRRAHMRGSSEDRDLPPKKKRRSRKSKGAEPAEPKSRTRGGGRYAKAARLPYEEAAETVAEAPRWRRLWPAAAKGVALFAVALVVFLYAFPATPPNHGKAGIVAGAEERSSCPNKT